MKAKRAYDKYSYPTLDTLRPHRQYYLTTTKLEFSPTDEVVPDNCVYLEEWVRDGKKICAVKYSGSTIPDVWTEDPFVKNARRPWVWVGDRSTETDLTKAFNKFLIVGNVIDAELIEHLTDAKDIFYLESGTFKELKFPDDGLVIQEYVDAVPSS